MLKVFVANRVTEILELSESKQWRHIPGNLNPADIVSRGTIDPTKLTTGRWFTAPMFLGEDEVDWPASIVGKLSDEDVEIKRKSLFVAMNLLLSETIDPERISSWSRLKRVAAWVLRFYENIQKVKTERNLTSTLKLVEVEK